MLCRRGTTLHMLQEHATSAAVAKTNFKGAISSVFAPYLRCASAGVPACQTPDLQPLQGLCTPALRSHAPVHSFCCQISHSSPHPLLPPCFSVYMDQVERDLMATLDRLMREETWQSLSADLPVLKSSNELVRQEAGAGMVQGAHSGSDSHTSCRQSICTRYQELSSSEALAPTPNAI